MLQQVQGQENKHIVITITDDENEWKMEQHANSKSSKTMKLIKGAVFLFVVGVTFVATSCYLNGNGFELSRELQSDPFSNFED